MRIANFERGNNILSRNKSLIILHPLDVCIKLRNERIEKKGLYCYAIRNF